MAKITNTIRKRSPPSTAEYEAYVGDLDAWVEDTELSFPRRMGLRLVVDLEGDDAALQDRVVAALDTDYVRFAKRAILDAARAAAEAAPDAPLGGAGPRRPAAGVRARNAAPQSGARPSAASPSA
jgi:hypothetical protein